MIQIRDLQFTYEQGSFCLQVDELSIEAGERIAWTGASGSGKTTLLHLVAGIASPSIGRVECCGTELTGLRDSARRDFRIANIGLVFQEFALLEYLSVLDNILLPYRISGALALNEEVRTRATLLAGQVGIEDKLRRYPRQLSQGERQRVALCRALLPQPPVILADEPTGNLDPANRDRVLELVFEYVKTRQATLIAVTHEHDLLDRFQRVEDVTELQQEGKQ